MIKIILAEDHNIVRFGIRNLLEKNDNFEIIGEAINGKDVLSLLDNGIVPDLILADMSMPDVGGIELVEQLSQRPFPVKTIFLTMHENENYVMSAFRVGAMGYLFKNIGADELYFAINQVYAGKKYICLELALRLLDRNLNASLETQEYDIPDADFSKRELEVLKLIAEGYTNQEIADRLFTSRRTVEGHRLALINKTGARNTPALIKFVMANKIIN